MARRLLAWVLILPLVAASVLVGHAVAYALTGRAEDGAHGYLSHAPVVLALASLAALVGLAVQQRARRIELWPFAALGPVVFTAQEHLERLANTGELPLLLADRSFALGMALQLPLAVAAVAIVRRLVVVLRSAVGTRRPSPGSETLLVLGPRATSPRARRLAVATLGRAPPALRRP